MLLAAEKSRLLAYLSYECGAAALDVDCYQDIDSFWAAKELLTLIMGNMAVVCTGISHGNVIQVSLPVD